MKVFAYEACQPDTPSGSFVARILHADGKWHPIIFAGASEGSVRAQAQTWWDDQMAKEEKKRAPKKKATDTPAEEVGDVL